LEEVNKKMIETLIIQLPDFTKVFKVECDASWAGIGGIHSQERHPVTNFSEKLIEAKQQYLTYDKEFYVVIQTLYY